MTIEDLLQFDDFMDGLAAVYEEYNLLEQEEENDPNDISISTEEKGYREKNILMKERYGISFSELWNFDKAIYKFLLPRLYVFYKEDIEGRNSVYYDEGTWEDIIKQILKMILLNLGNDGSAFNKEETITHIAGMTLLTRYIKKLWI